jgi:hypothetical protein
MQVLVATEGQQRWPSYTDLQESSSILSGTSTSQIPETIEFGV